MILYKRIRYIFIYDTLLSYIFILFQSDRKEVKIMITTYDSDFPVKMT